MHTLEEKAFRQREAFVDIKGQCSRYVHRTMAGVETNRMRGRR